MTYINISLLFSFILLSSYVLANSSVKSSEVNDYGLLPASTNVSLSPDGNKLAFIKNIQGHSLIGVMDTSNGKTKYYVKTDNNSFKISWYQWANNHVLLVNTRFPIKKGRFKYTTTRLFKVNLESDTGIEPVLRSKRMEHESQFQSSIVDVLPNDPDHILMALDRQIRNRPDVYKISLKSTSSRKLVHSGEEDIYNWMTDQQHKVRIGYGRTKTKKYYRIFDVKSRNWKKVWQYEIFESAGVSPLGFALDPNILFIRADHKGKYAVFKVDVSTKALKKELVYADKNYDVSGRLIYSKITNDVVGIHHDRVKNGRVYFDKAYQNFQDSLDTAIKGTANEVVSYSADEKKYILYTSSSTSPGKYYLGNREVGGVSLILQAYPQLNKHSLSKKRRVEFKARDGLTIEGYVTPPQKTVKNRNAAILLPHGGPMARSSGGFYWLTQFFSNQGYTVFEPNFRGSSGYGFEFAMKSIRQWGGAMQNDLTDAAKWLAKSSDIDQGKICIVGASYGGYAAMMAAVRKDNLFQCAVSIAGVSDLELIVEQAKGFTNYEVVKKQIGDDEDILEANSPVNFAEKIDIPVLLIHGTEDRVVDFRHSEEMYEELINEGKDVEFVELPNGDHYLSREQNRLKMLNKIEKFLRNNI